MEVIVHTKVNAPDGATHYLGDLLDNPSWFKVTQVGVVGDHWWKWKYSNNAWVLSGHSRPHWLKEILKVNKV